MHGCQGAWLGGMSGCRGHALLWGGMRVCRRGACVVVGGVHGYGGHVWL